MLQCSCIHHRVTCTKLTPNCTPNCTPNLTPNLTPHQASHQIKSQPKSHAKLCAKPRSKLTKLTDVNWFLLFMYWLQALKLFWILNTTNCSRYALQGTSKEVPTYHVHCSPWLYWYLAYLDNHEYLYYYFRVVYHCWSFCDASFMLMAQ